MEILTLWKYFWSLTVYSENKGADQLHGYHAADLHGYHSADLRLCFRICEIAGFLMTRLVYLNSNKTSLYLNYIVSVMSKYHLKVLQVWAWVIYLQLLKYLKSLKVILITLLSDIYEPCYEKTGFLHMRKQRRRSASR